MVWLDEDRVIAALDRKLAMVITGEQHQQHQHQGQQHQKQQSGRGIVDVIQFPEFHSDTIRQIALNPLDRTLVISGGFDGNVFVTNIQRLFEDIQRNEKKSENSVYVTRGVVGSVSWHISDANVASATTDAGIIHIFDCRTDQSKPAFIYDTRKTGLYTHCYLDDFTICLGYSDGSLQIHDIRHGQEALTFRDPYQQAVGDIKLYNHMLGADQARLMHGGDETAASTAWMRTICVFGANSLSLWNIRDQNIECL